MYLSLCDLFTGGTTVMVYCKVALSCHQRCTVGYNLLIICDLFTAGTTVLVYCKEALSCHQGCTVGYKCDTIGCPTCSCIKPSGMYT